MLVGHAGGGGGGDPKGGFHQIQQHKQQGHVTQSDDQLGLTYRTGTGNQAAAGQQARLAFRGGAIRGRPAAGE